MFHSLKDAILTSRGGSSTTSAGGAAATTNAPAPQLHVGDRLLAGAAAGAASVVVTYPLESLRTLMSVAGGMRGSLLQVAGRVVASQGAAGLYRGFQACLIGDMLGNALGFSLFEVGCRWVQRGVGREPRGCALNPGLRGAWCSMPRQQKQRLFPLWSPSVLGRLVHSPSCLPASGAGSTRNPTAAAMSRRPCAAWWAGCLRRSR